MLCSYFNILNQNKLIENLVSQNSSEDEKTDDAQLNENTGENSSEEPNVSTDAKPTLWSSNSSTLIVPEQENQ